jgi:hypothetical protein
MGEKRQDYYRASYIDPTGEVMDGHGFDHDMLAREMREMLARAESTIFMKPHSIVAPPARLKGFKRIAHV